VTFKRCTGERANERVASRALRRAGALAVNRAARYGQPCGAELRARTNRLRERANEAADRCCEHVADGLPRAAQAATSKPRGLPQASWDARGRSTPRRCGRATRADRSRRCRGQATRASRALPRASHAGEPHEQAAEPGGAAHRAEAAAGPRPRASSQGGPAHPRPWWGRDGEERASQGGVARQSRAPREERPRRSRAVSGGAARDAGGRAGCHGRASTAMAEPRRGHRRTGARCRAKAGRRPSLWRASRTAAPWPRRDTEPRRDAEATAARGGAGRRIRAGAHRGRVGGRREPREAGAMAARRCAEPRRAGPRHGRDAGRAGQGKGEKGRGREEGEPELTTEGLWRRGRTASVRVRPATRRRGRESHALGGSGEGREKGGGSFGGGCG
jgi:hypothetical protein